MIPRSFVTASSLLRIANLIWRLQPEPQNRTDELATAKDLKLQVVRLAVNLPDMSGSEVACRILQIAPGTALIVMSLYHDGTRMKRSSETGR